MEGRFSHFGKRQWCLSNGEIGNSDQHDRLEPQEHVKSTGGLGLHNLPVPIVRGCGPAAQGSSDSWAAKGSTEMR
jgi:hypothetical protein